MLLLCRYVLSCVVAVSLFCFVLCFVFVWGSLFAVVVVVRNREFVLVCC